MSISNVYKAKFSLNVLSCLLVPFALTGQELMPSSPQRVNPQMGNPLSPNLQYQQVPQQSQQLQQQNPVQPLKNLGVSAEGDKNTNGVMKVPGVPERAQQILHYWFGELPTDDYFPAEKMDVWFASRPDIDREIRENFTADVNAAARGDLNSWRETPLGRLALILLLDQFPRHIYRNRPQSFASDPMARGLVLEGLQKGDDRVLFPIERAFFYLPLEHSEDLDMQNLAVALYRQLYLTAPLGVKPQMQSFYEYALIHQRQIARFGRFPHRNAVLGRRPTPDELTFLREGK